MNNSNKLPSCVKLEKKITESNVTEMVSAERCNYTTYVWNGLLFPLKVV